MKKLLFGAALLAACSSSDPAPGYVPELALPPTNAMFDYQLGGAYEPPAGVTVVSRDRNDAPAPGLYNICYLNGFQIQPDEEGDFESLHPDLILRDAGGDPVIDAGWGEMLIDTSTPEKRLELDFIVAEWMDGCAAAGFDAIEIDNLDSYSRSNGLLDMDDNVAMMRRLADSAHARDLPIAQKNSTELLPRRDEMTTDFAIAEECNQWDECAEYVETYGDYVFVIEYEEGSFDAGCQTFPGLSIVLRDLDLVTPDDLAYVYDGC